MDTMETTSGSDCRAGSVRRASSQIDDDINKYVFDWHKKYNLDNFEDLISEIHHQVYKRKLTIVKETWVNIELDPPVHQRDSGTVAYVYKSANKTTEHYIHLAFLLIRICREQLPTEPLLDSVDEITTPAFIDRASFLFSEAMQVIDKLKL